MRAAAFLVLLLGLAAAPYADCTTPAAPEGKVQYNSGKKVLQYCNGSSWINLGLSNPAGGTACTNPTGPEGMVFFNTNTNVMEYCNGTNWVNMGNANPGATGPCTSPSGTLGHLIYNSTAKKPQYCNGTQWINAANWEASGTPAVNVAAFSFPDLFYKPLGTLVTSSIVTISGASSSPVTISGSGSPQFSINSGAWSTSGQISSGQTIQLRMTTPSISSTLTSLTVTIGNTSSIWNVTTAPVFVLTEAWYYQSYNNNQTLTPNIACGGCASNSDTSCTIGANFSVGHTGGSCWTIPNTLSLTGVSGNMMYPALHWCSYTPVYCHAYNGATTPCGGDRSNALHACP